MERIRNTATIQDLIKVFKANGVTMVDTPSLTLSTEGFAERFKEMILDILRQTQRPLEKQLAQALRDATNYVVPKDSAKKFGGAICDVVAMARSKKKHMTSGARLPKFM